MNDFRENGRYELRLGNLLLYKGEIIHPVLSYKFITSQGSINEGRYRDYSGLPMTISLLEQTGFSVKQAGTILARYVFERAEFKVVLRQEGKTSFVLEEPELPFLNAEPCFNYYHQLQNFFFFLYGQELLLVPDAPRDSIKRFAAFLKNRLSYVSQ